MKQFNGTQIEGSIVQEKKEKEQKGGKVNNNLVWNTEKMNAVRKALERGEYIEGQNPFFEKNLDLKKDNLIFDYTEEELQEFVKCKNDILYFAEKYCKIKNELGQYEHFKLREYQKNVLTNFADNRFVVYCSARQSGKCYIYQGLTEINGRLIPIGELYDSNKKQTFLSKIKKVLYSIYGKLK